MQAPRFDPFRRVPDRRPPVLTLGRDAAVGAVTVLALVDRYPPFVNAGGEWMLHAMLRDSVRRGHRVIVATECCDEPTVFDGVEVHPVAGGLAAAIDAELVVSHLAYTRQAVDHARGNGLPLVYLVHNDDQVRWWQIRREDVTAYVWNSEWIAAAARSNDETWRTPGTIIRPPLVATDYAVADPLPGQREFVTLVNPIQAKGAELFYRLARRNRGRRFLAVEGAYGSQERPHASDRNVTWQRQTPRFAADVLARTRVLLVPSHYESWGRVAVEALAAGVPVVACPTPGLVEACGDAGIYAPENDLDAWHQALRALDDPACYADWSAAALARARELDRLGQTDLERWDRLVRLAAGARRVAASVGRMTTPNVKRYDPWRGGGTHQATPRPQDAQEPAPPLQAIRPDGGPQEATERPILPPWPVPEKATEVVAGLRAVDGGEAEARAVAALAREQQRPHPRRSVLAAVERVLGPVQVGA